MKKVFKNSVVEVKVGDFVKVELDNLFRGCKGCPEGTWKVINQDTFCKQGLLESDEGVKVNVDGVVWRINLINWHKNVISPKFKVGEEVEIIKSGANYASNQSLLIRDGLELKPFLFGFAGMNNEGKKFEIINVSVNEVGVVCYLGMLADKLVSYAEDGLRSCSVLYVNSIGEEFTEDNYGDRVWFYAERGNFQEVRYTTLTESTVMESYMETSEIYKSKESLLKAMIEECK